MLGNGVLAFVGAAVPSAVIMVIGRNPHTRSFLMLFTCICHIPAQEQQQENNTSC